ncbi:hypothetical protein BC830DRAFT_515384 [Chytriomyces sp. MP71]|nr:hypothetical protein BC830DRAFT_515384 [Chytriomyces sp. MP71]
MVTERLNKLFKLGDSLYGLRDIFENNGDRISDYFDPAIHWETALSQLPNMNKLGANELLSYACETIPKTKRFSSLTQIELSSLWKDTTSYICQQVSAKKAINLPGVGAFYIRKYKLATGDITETSVPCFIPAKAWEKVPGYTVNQVQLTGSNAAEPMNYAAVASINGFSREDAETGLKDIVHALFLILKRGSNVSLGFPEMGKLVFYNRDIKFKLRTFLKRYIYLVD